MTAIRPTLFLALVALFLVSCITDTPAPVATFTPVPASTNTPVPPTPIRLPQHAHVLRVALLGDITTTNVWMLFDEAGASYWNEATQAGYWPVLYRLAPPSLDFQPVTAQGGPSPVLCDTTSCTATVTLQPGLTWTDGSAFTAADVVFTVNTALQFQLGLNWREYYNPEVLDHAEAVDDRTVKYYFKTHPTVADWQYGVLQGPVVNQEFWQPRIVDALALLPGESLLSSKDELQAQLALMQSQLDAMNLSLVTSIPGSTDYVNTTRQVSKLQDDMIGVSNSLEKTRAEYEAKLDQARVTLYELDPTGEPTLGTWKFAGRSAGILENKANLSSPLGHPWFDNVRYVVYADEASAVQALIDNQVDLVLVPNGLSPESVSHLAENADISLSRNMSRSARFLGFNHTNPYLADPALHRALACMLNPSALMETLEQDAAPLSGFVMDDFWQDKSVSLPCAGDEDAARLVEAIRFLKEAGYTWKREPSLNASGSQLTAPGGTPLGSFKLLAPKQDPLRSLAAQYIAQQAKILGLRIDVKLSSTEELMYAVYGTGDYDMALLGWRLSAYPAYLCDWYTPGGRNPVAYNGSGQGSACETWAQVSDLETAKASAYEVQSALMQDLPLIPLFAGVRVDAYRNIRYPFARGIDGLGGLYGAPELAIPIP